MEKDKRKIAVFALSFVFAVAVAMLIIFFAKPQKIKLSGKFGIGKIIGKQKLDKGFFKNIENQAAGKKG